MEGSPSFLKIGDIIPLRRMVGMCPSRPTDRQRHIVMFANMSGCSLRISSRTLSGPGTLLFFNICLSAVYSSCLNDPGTSNFVGVTFGALLGGVCSPSINLVNASAIKEVQSMGLVLVEIFRALLIVWFWNSVSPPWITSPICCRISLTFDLYSFIFLYQVYALP